MDKDNLEAMGFDIKDTRKDFQKNILLMNPFENLQIVDTIINYDKNLKFLDNLLMNFKNDSHGFDSENIFLETFTYLRQSLLSERNKFVKENVK